MSDDPISLRDGMTLAEMQWAEWYLGEKEQVQVSQTIVNPFPVPGFVVFAGQDLRPEGQLIGLSFEWKPDGGTGQHIGANSRIYPGGLSFALVAVKPSGPGTARWWWHDGDDFEEPPLGVDGDHGTLTWDGKAWTEAAA